MFVKKVREIDVLLFRHMMNGKVASLGSEESGPLAKQCFHVCFFEKEDIQHEGQGSHNTSDVLSLGQQHFLLNFQEYLPLSIAILDSSQ